PPLKSPSLRSLLRAWRAGTDMAWRQRRKRAGDGEGFDLRLWPHDRIGGPPKRASVGSSSRSRKRRSSRKSRSGIGRLIYWGAVLALWAVIAGIGALVWIGIHLPPIQSLEIPKRPPSVLILGETGATLATRRDIGGAAVPLAEMP